jgi:hypothetical protein
MIRNPHARSDISAVRLRSPLTESAIRIRSRAYNLSKWAKSGGPWRQVGDLSRCGSLPSTERRPGEADLIEPREGATGPEWAR